MGSVTVTLEGEASLCPRGRPGKIVALIGCSRAKLGERAAARRLYTSALFRKAVAYAKALECEWAILSAKHGLVLPDQVLEPYDFTFRDLARELGSPQRAAEQWGAHVAATLKAQWPGDVSFVLLAGEGYATCVRELPHHAPLAGMGVGRRLAWLAEETERFGLSEPEAVELARCDFCGREEETATSELGEQRFEGDDTPARICERCARWALESIRARRASGEPVLAATAEEG